MRFAMEQIIKSGKTKEEAIAKALGELGMRRQEVRVEVLEEGARGFLGFGGRDVKVRVSPSNGDDPLPDDLDPERVTRGILDPLGIDYRLDLRREGDVFFVKVNSRDDEGLLIGRRGQTLDAIKHLVQRILSSQAGQPVSVNFEVGDYRERREDALREKAEAVASKVLELGKSLSLEPMTAQDRRIVHMHLAEREDLRTYTAGEGSRRRVVVALAGDAGDAGAPEVLDEREPASPYEDIPDPSFRSTAVSSMARHRQDEVDRDPRRSRSHDERPRRRGRRERDDFRELREDEESRPVAAPEERREVEEGREPRRSRSREDRPREDRPRRRGRGEDRREEGGTRIRKTFRRDEEGRREDEHRSEDRGEDGAQRHEAPLPSAAGRPEWTRAPKVEDGDQAKPFSSELARSVLGLDETGGPAKPAKKRRYR